MKLRQKLAAVLAATMVVTAVPVVTMAASKNETTHVAKVTEGTRLDGNVAPDLKIELKDGITTTSPIYVTLENATWDTDEDKNFPYHELGNPVAGKTSKVSDVKNASGAVVGAFHVVSIDEEEIAIQYVSAAGNVADSQAISETKDYVLHLPMNVTVTGGEAKAHIAGTKWVTATGENGIAIATTKDGTASIVKPASTPSFYTEGGKVATIVLEEDTIGALAATAKGRTTNISKDGIVTLNLDFDVDDFELDTAKQTAAIDDITVKFSRGFASDTVQPAFANSKVDNSVTANATTPTVKVYEDTIEIKVPESYVSGSDIGRIEISNVRMKSTERKPALGEISVSVDNDAFDNTDVVVANVAEYGVKLTNTNVKEKEKAVAMVSGRKEKVKFTLEETVDATITGDRQLDFVLDQGFFVDGTIEINHNNTTGTKDHVVTPITNTDGDITGFSIKTSTDTDDKKIDKFEVQAEVILPMSKEGDITVTASGRAIGSEETLVIAQATPAIKVESETFEINTGIKAQKGGKVVITETDKAAIEKGNLEITLPAEDGITFTDEAKVEVKSGDIKVDQDDIEIRKVFKLKLDEVAANKDFDNDGSKSASTYGYITVDEVTFKEYDKKNNYVSKEQTGVKLVIPVTRTSKEASVIEITDFEVKLDRSVPTGAYSLKVGGSAIGTKGSFEQKGFFQVGIKSEDAGEKVVTTISKDATKMVVNGKDVELAAPAYINGNKLMAPLRAVANAFGFNNEAINYNAATKEILVRGNGSVIKLTIGSKQAYVDGTPVTLAVAAEIKAEATYVPVGDLARLLGITVEWDAATKTATFKN